MKDFVSPAVPIPDDHTGLPLHGEEGEGQGTSIRGTPRAINRNKGVGGSSRRKGKGKVQQSNAGSDPEWGPWMEAQTSRKKLKSLFCFFKFIYKN